MTKITAKTLGLQSCHDCHLLVNTTENHDTIALCPRCGSKLHPRKTNSISRTWALVITAMILYIPANLLPITITTAVGIKQSDTILSGVIYFFQEGSWEIASIIFFASIFVPFAKLSILIFLLISVQMNSRWRPKDRTALYRLTEAVGRWSMVDIYVVTILVALVKLGAIATIEAGPAAIYFAAVVVVTMFAAESFDPRLIWDTFEEK